MALLLLAALLTGSGWEYLPGQGFVNSDTGDIKTPEAFLALGEKLHADHKYDETADAMGVLVASQVDAALRERALLLRARALAAGGRLVEARDEYIKFVQVFRFLRDRGARGADADRPGAGAREGRAVHPGPALYRSSRPRAALKGDAGLSLSRARSSPTTTT